MEQKEAALQELRIIGRVLDQITVKGHEDVGRMMNVMQRVKSLEQYIYEYWRVQETANPEEDVKVEFKPE